MGILRPPATGRHCAFGFPGRYFVPFAGPELDTPMSRVLPQMPDDASSERSRSGEDRTFIYRFTDGSRLTLGPAPQGGGRGWVLYYVDVEG